MWLFPDHTKMKNSARFINIYIFPSVKKERLIDIHVLIE